MIRVFRTFDDKPCGVVLQFGSAEGLDKLVPEVSGNEVYEGFKKKSRLFPGLVGFLWRDDFGFNPALIWNVVQYGPPFEDVVMTDSSVSLFGSRRLGFV